MKKIILVLMMMVSVSFSASSFSSTSVDGIYTADNVCFVSTGSVVYTAPGNARSSMVFFDACDNVMSGVQCMAFYNTRAFLGIKIVTCPNTCTGGKVYDVTSNTCVLPNDSYTCDPFLRRYPSSSGQCVDCSNSNNVSAIAACVCDAVGSTYTGGKVDMVASEKGGSYSYTKTTTHCDNGVSFPVYTDPVSIPTDNNGTTPDNNNTTPSTPDNNSTTPTDGNTTTTPSTTPSQADVIQALKDIQNGLKDENTALKDIGLDAKAIKEQMAKNGTTYSDMLAQMQQGNAKADKMYQLMDDNFKGQVQYQNAMGKWINQDLLNATAQLGATNDVKNAVNGTTSAVNNATNAINTQGKAITDKLGEIKDALKDMNGTDMGPTNDILEKIHKDTNGTVSGLDKLHKDFNTTNDYLEKILGFFDSNATVDTNGSGSSFSLSDMLPDGGMGWFSSNALDLNFGGISGSGSNCQCATAEFRVAGKMFVFPPPELLDMIPFSTISKILMALIYLLGLKTFLRI